jgi:hypothetical protein
VPIIVFIFYYILFSLLLLRIGFIKKTNWSKWMIVGLFSIKILAGVAYGIFYLQPAYNETSDTWNYFKLSKNETDWFLRDPVSFFKDIFVYGYSHSGNLFLGEDSYWNDLKSNIVIKLLALCNVLTLKNYYADIIFFNFIFFFGPVAFYRLIDSLFPVKRAVLIAGIFLIPSFLFWCSGIHKDGLIFLCIALVLFHFQKQLHAKSILPASLFICILSFIALFALRNFMAILLLPALIVWLLIYFHPTKTIVIITTVYGAGAVLFFLSGKINTRADLPQLVIQKQTEFKQLPGNSQVSVPLLENSITSFLKFFPTAFDIAFFRPHITEIRNKSYIPAAAETILLWMLVLYSILFYKKKSSSPQQISFLVCCICFSISFLLLAGYTITLSGAIVRYRAVVLPLLFIPVLQIIDANIKKRTAQNTIPSKSSA